MLQPEGERFVWARTTSVDGWDVRIENPGMQVPATFLLDDPAPLRNPMFYQRAMRDYVEEVPNSFATAFAEMVERTGMRGKFSLLPYPIGLGRIDQGLTGVAPAQLEEFLVIVRERITPRFDISPEMLTHWNALDLATGRLLPYWEHDWSRRQNREVFTPYISLALEILNNVDIPANGVTSPWDFGHGVEDEYVPAILAAQQRVNNLALTWYMLDWDGTSRFVSPRVMHLDTESATAVVSIVSGDGFDFAWETQDGAPASIDRLISRDGTSGRLVDLARAGSPISFLSHWQSLFSNGSAAGLQALEEVANRIGDHLGAAVRWTTPSSLARTAVAAAATSISVMPGDNGSVQRIAVSAPFSCPSFTLSIAGLPLDNSDIQVVSVEKRPMVRQTSAAGSRILLPTNCWTTRDGRLYACWDVREGVTELVIATE